MATNPRAASSKSRRSAKGRLREDGPIGGGDRRLSRLVHRALGVEDGHREQKQEHKSGCGIHGTRIALRVQGAERMPRVHVEPLRPPTGSAPRAEAQLIAGRSPMPLFLADIHLHRTRTFRDKAELARAAKLVRDLGYGRRTEELAAAAAAELVASYAGCSVSLRARTACIAVGRSRSAQTSSRSRPGKMALRSTVA